MGGARWRMGKTPGPRQHEAAEYVRVWRRMKTPRAAPIRVVLHMGLKRGGGRPADKVVAAVSQINGHPLGRGDLARRPARPEGTTHQEAADHRRGYYASQM